MGSFLKLALIYAIPDSDKRFVFSWQQCLSPRNWNGRGVMLSAHIYLVWS